MPRKRTRLVVFDLDGTLYRGSEPTPHAADAVSELRRRGAEVRFFTNNSSQLPESIASKLVGMGIAAAAEEVLTSGMVAARGLRELGYRRVLVVGEDGLAATLERGGLEASRGMPSPDAVLAGICRDLDYGMLDRALQAFLAGAAFFATNADATYPLEGGRLQPGAGATAGALAGCIGGPPKVFGKPQPDGLLLLMAEAGVAPGETLVVGDRVETDLASGLAAGCKVCLVLTGVTPSPIKGVPFCTDLSGLIIDDERLSESK